ncbi:MAG: DNA-binding response regulator [Runella slithyformis]|nr:MAG: DNA-binding response regulator [Runella sp.]TAG21413.1 MAG: DNA-binding response regulator [Cytophagales bacterium]TAG40764.1 MAG: DNA-binding response regulator [Cytophagia bacterium]TAG48437.1 MAG: DNA-binding response regulator [Runella slithyformis]TAG68843.1 MAG: DNA-binding response regulator [Runella slithyformis]
MTKILLVEDDPNLGELLQEYLNSKNYVTDLAINGELGLVQFLNNTYDLCIFDVMMPKKDGFTLAKEVRMKDKEIPIIFLTAKSMKEDTVQGFKAGADDYITKPFSMEELLLRIQAVLRRYQRLAPTLPVLNIFEVGQYTFDFDHQTLKLKGNIQKLTSKESALLKLFCENKNQPISRSFALKLIWGNDSYFNARSMDVYITKLRKLLKEDDSLQIINLHGEGFKLMVA